ncbi:ribonuclease H-like domain-containing protein [Tanacetum coccineum]|uniref:Ribonuclease H-like domain-containing protein n=1 Tax=Tanacetum coccineum TaxID=301880 RepID=A0ABQ5FXG7_9ASTR
MTISTKNMFNVVDISNLKLTVGHPNGTMAKNFAIGSLRLTNNVVLFDVLVVPEYNISLLSVNKMNKDSKYFVGFPESKCYIHDLKLGKIVGTGSEYDGLYMFDCDDNGKNSLGLCNLGIVCYVSKDLWRCRLGHLADQVLSVLGDKVGFKEKKHVSACDICHKAKQTREPFPLRGHKSVSLGDLIHLDVWGPYKVVSKDGYKYFLTVVDYFSRATSCSYTPQQNDIAERKHRYLLNVSRSLMLPSYVLSGARPFKIVHGKEPSLSRLKAFGCLCYSTVLNNSDKFGAGYKARLVAKDFSQREGLDYEEIFSHVVKMVTVRYLIGLVVFNNWPLYQLDVNNAFLYSDLHEEVYMSLPPGYYDKNETKVCRFVKSLYGLKQAPRQWNEKLTCALIENGFIQSKNDYSLYVKSKKGMFTALLVYVDDIDVTSNNHAEIEKKYCLELLSDYGLLACKPAATQLQQNIVFSFKESEKDNRHMHAPLQSHFAAGLRVLRYLKQAPGTGIHFYKCNKISLHAFSDADWAKCPKSRKSVSEDLDVEGLFPVNLFCDRSSAIQVAANLVFHEKTKHFEINLHLSGLDSIGLSVLVRIDCTEDQHSYDVHRYMRKVIAFQTWLSKFPIILDQLLDLEVLTSYSNVTVVEDQPLIFQQLMNLLLDKD